MGTIIVGIDGSASSDSALDWALAEARLRSSSLRAIHAWQTPIGDTGLAVPGFPAAGLPLEQREELRSNYRRAAQSLLDEVLQRARKEPFLELDAKIVEGSAAEILIAAAEDAELLVSDHEAGEQSPDSCSARSASTASSTRSLRWSYSLQCQRSSAHSSSRPR